MENKNQLNQWANFPVMLEGRRILLSTEQDPSRVFEATWEATCPNGKYARLAEPLQKIGAWHKISEISLHDVLDSGD